MLKKLNVFALLHSLSTATTIKEGPVSVTALVGTNAQYHPDILARGITVVTLPSSGTVQSTLTVPATSVNNGTTVRCVISVSLFMISTPAISNYSTLTVLPGELIKR